MSSIAFEIIGILLLLIANGLFSMAEMAVVSSRKARLRTLAEAGDSAAKAAFDLADSPNRFLSTVQVGITLVGVLTGVFGGATLARELAKVIALIPGLAEFSKSLALGIVVIGITYLSLIVGELVPKRLAILNPEGIARVVARPMMWLAWLAAPVIDFLGHSTDFVLNLFRIRRDKQASEVTEDEVKGLVREGMDAGVFDSNEFAMVAQVLALDRLPVQEIMTPRPKMIWLDQDDASDRIWHKVVISKHSVFPVFRKKRDQVTGIVDVKSIYSHVAVGIPLNLADLVTPALVVPELLSVTKLLEQFKTSHKKIALVADEFGHIIGLVTLVDVLEAITGDFPTLNERLRPDIKQRPDGTWLIDGLLDIQSVQEKLQGFKIDPKGKADYQTVAGFVLAQLGQMPTEQDAFEFSGWRFEILDMDHLRIDKILATSLAELPPENTQPPLAPTASLPPETPDQKQG